MYSKCYASWQLQILESQFYKFNVLAVIYTGYDLLAVVMIDSYTWLSEASLSTMINLVILNKYFCLELLNVHVTTCTLRKKALGMRLGSTCPINII